MKKMTYFIAICLLSGSIACQSIKLREQVIDQKALTIKQMITRHNYAVAGLTALGYIQQLSYWLPVLVDGTDYFFGDPNSNRKLDQAALEVKKAEELGFFAGIAKDTKELFCTSTGWRRIGDAGLYLGGQLGAFFLFQKISETVYHPDTLRWYIYAKVPYEKTVTVIEGLAKKLSADDIYDNQELLLHYKNILSLSCIQLMGYGEDMCAYMVYKSVGLSKNQKMLAESSYRYLLNYHNDVFKVVSTELCKEKPVYGQIVTLMQSYRSELKYQRKLFASIEGETQEELRSMARYY